MWTPKGLRTVFVLFAIRLATRRVEVLGITDKADEEFMRQVARNVTATDRGPVLEGATHLIIDSDTRFAKHFRSTLEDGGIECVRIPPRAPDCNSFAERWVKSVKSECRNKMTFFGIGSLRRAISEFVDHYNTERAHQALDNSIPIPGDMVGRNIGEVIRHDRLGGVLRHYHRAD